MALLIVEQNVEVVLSVTHRVFVQHHGLQALRLRAQLGAGGHALRLLRPAREPHGGVGGDDLAGDGMAVFGGLGTIWGPALGALLLYTVNEALRFVGVVYNLIAVGLVIMVFVIFVPRGLAGLRPRSGPRTPRRDGATWDTREKP